MNIKSKYLIGRNDTQATVRVDSDEGVHMVSLRRPDMGGSFTPYEIVTPATSVQPLSQAEFKLLASAAAELANS